MPFIKMSPFTRLVSIHFPSRTFYIVFFGELSSSNSPPFPTTGISITATLPDGIAMPPFSPPIPSQLTPTSAGPEFWPTTDFQHVGGLADPIKPAQTPPDPPDNNPYVVHFVIFGTDTDPGPPPITIVSGFIQAMAFHKKPPEYSLPLFTGDDFFVNNPTIAGSAIMTFGNTVGGSFHLPTAHAPGQAFCTFTFPTDPQATNVSVVWST